jgi:hypothetical protein
MALRLPAHPGQRAGTLPHHQSKCGWSTKQHVAYHKRPRLRGDKNKPKKDNEMRSIRDDFGFVVPGYPPGWMEPYREAWHLLAE